MKNIVKKILLLALMLHATIAFSQERFDDYMFVRMMQTDAVDLKCEVYPCEKPSPHYSWDMLRKEIPRLIESGRYIISISFMKFGVVVLHKQNTDQIKQLFKVTILDKDIKDMFKRGYSLKYYNNGGDYALYELNPKVTKQVFLKKAYEQEKNQKKLAKLNAQGLYIAAIKFSHVILQNGRDDIVDETWEKVLKDDALSTIEAKHSQGYITSNVFAYYRDLSYSRWDNVEVVFDKPRDGNVRGESVARVRTQEEFVDFLSRNVKPGYNIDMTWCGWDGQTGRNKISEPSSTASTSIWDVLGGLTTSITGLIAGPSGSNTVVGNVSSDSNSGSGHSHSGSSISNRCSLCQGSGNCTPKSYSNRKSACSGSGLCGYCNGTGLVGSGNNQAICTACNGNKKCKTCRGTGKCQQCNGTGKK